MLFITCCHDVMRGVLKQTADSAVLLAGLLLFIRLGPYDPARVFYLPNLYEGTIPDSLLPLRAPEVWNGLIASSYARLGDLGGGENKVQLAKELYCNTLEESELFGNHIFKATQTFSRILPSPLLLGISAEGILFLNVDLQPLQLIALQNIELWTGMCDGGLGEEGTKGKPVSNLSNIKGFFQITLKPSPSATTSLFSFSSSAGGQLYNFSCSEGGTAASLLRAFTEQLLREIVEEEKDAPSLSVPTPQLDAVLVVGAGGKGGVGGAGSP